MGKDGLYPSSDMDAIDCQVVPGGPSAEVVSVVRYRMSFATAGARGGVVVKALRYKPAGRGFDSRWCHWNFSLT
jgi:hypothetical protein